MCTCHGPRGATRFSPGASRRRFLATCGAAAAVGALEPFVSRGRAAEEKKARVGLVFLANSAEREIWPYPGFDCATRQKEILAVLEAVRRGDSPRRRRGPPRRARPRLRAASPA